ncbi:unnamed protein product [Lactuca saligna]|uniref:Uncharacterized protein n=1 Tax=Lactuca saligna TaxID=75948 RepID=A0AA35YTI5_LACSI|nr:unnamed protein product [Lactuca saligna]
MPRSYIDAKCTKLWKIYIKHCPVSDHGMEVVALGCPNLVKLKVDRMEYYRNGINEDLWNCITSGDYHPWRLEQTGTAGSSDDVSLQAYKQKENDKKCLYELFGALPPVVYNYFEVESTEVNGPGDEGFLMNSEDEVMAYYSNNKVKKLLNKPFNLKFKGNSGFKGNSLSGKIVREESKVEKKESKNASEKVEKKLKGDSQGTSSSHKYANDIDSTLLTKGRM